MANLRRYQFLYAVLDEDMDYMCIGIDDTTINHDGNPNYVPITSDMNGLYFAKYYNHADGKWYYDVEHTKEVVELNQ